jgi:hypothetical protein
VRTLLRVLIRLGVQLLAGLSFYLNEQFLPLIDSRNIAPPFAGSLDAR